MQILKKSFLKINQIVNKKPLVVFFVGLLFLFSAIYISNKYRSESSNNEVQQKVVAKTVQVYRIGESSKAVYLAEIEKNNLLTVYALTQGIVNTLNYKEGDSVSAYSNLAYISNNYIGGNIATNQRKLSEIQYKNAIDSYKTNTEIINKQKELAKNMEENDDNLREIAVDSFESTRSLIDLNKTIVVSLEDQIKDLQSTNVGGVNDEDILSKQQLLANYKGALNSLQNTFRNSKYTNGESSKVSQISSDQKEITLAQLDLQKKSFALNLEILELQYTISKINESLSYPSLPFSTTIQSVEVNEGDLVSPGTPLFKVVSKNTVLQAKVYVNKQTTEKISLLSESKVVINSSEYSVFPAFISSEPVKGNLYLVIFNLPSEVQNKTYNSQSVYIKIPLDQKLTSSSFPFVPIDTIYQTSDSSYIYIYQDGKAKSLPVGLGNVYGSYVEITTNLPENANIIINRDVVSDQLVTVN